MTQRTQDIILIQEINDNLILLKDGGASLVLTVSAVNFGLLSQKEQLAIVDGFAQFLNSLSFSIQIVVTSTKLNISSYLILLDSAQRLQNNPLLSAMMTRYRNFIQTVIKDNEVLDKNFYIIINLASFELGLNLGLNKAQKMTKIKASILPRRDQIIRLLGRIGIKATQLTNSELIKLFYDLYNQPVNFKPLPKVQISPVKLTIPQTPARTIPTPNIPARPLQPISTEINRPSRTHPFVVEELADSI